MGIFGNAFGWPHMLIILAVVLLLFGATRLPALAKSMGQSARAFRGEMKAMKEEDAAAVPGVASSAAIDAPDAKTEAPVTTEAPTASGGSAEPKL